METSTEFYDAAIGKLITYRDTEPNRDLRDNATSEIEKLQLAKAQAHLDEVVKRTANLQQLMGVLGAVVTKAKSGGSIAGGLAKVDAFVGTIAEKVNELSDAADGD